MDFRTDFSTSIKKGNKDVNVFWVPTKNCHLYLEYDNVVVSFNKEAVVINKNNFVELHDKPNYYLLFLNKGYSDITKWMLKQNLPSLGTEAVIENGEWMEN